MPNWACGTVTVRGKKENIRKFFSRFICGYEKENSDKRVIPGIKFFARSFYNGTREGLNDDINEQLAEYINNFNLCECYLTIDFAWSALSCLIKEYPQKYLDECITLKDACIEDKVSVDITTEEEGMCFEEHITCDENGNLVNECNDMPEYKCKKCGEKLYIPSYNDPSEYECDNCGENDWELIKKDSK